MHGTFLYIITEVKTTIWNKTVSLTVYTANSTKHHGHTNPVPIPKCTSPSSTIVSHRKKYKSGWNHDSLAFWVETVPLQQNSLVVVMSAKQHTDLPYFHSLLPSAELH
jgi:hypothetical protein